MTRLFRRGELKAALLDALDAAGPANGYTVMQTLSERIGDSWHPSPGAVYPALLALEDTGLVTTVDRDGARLYQLTSRGRQAATTHRGTLEAVAERARNAPPAAPTLGAVVDAFAADMGRRTSTLAETQHQAVAAILEGARRNIERIMGHKER